MGRTMIAMAVLAIAATALVTLATPQFIEPMFLEPPVWSNVFTAIGLVGPIVGLVWMVRIYRADPEPDQSAWRYRAKR